MVGVSRVHRVKDRPMRGEEVSEIVLAVVAVMWFLAVMLYSIGGMIAVSAAGVLIGATLVVISASRRG